MTLSLRTLEESLNHVYPPAKIQDCTTSKTLKGCPNELIHQICSNLSFKQVKVLRLVCRRFGDVGFEHLVVRAQVTFVNESIEDLNNLSLSGICKRIASLHFNPDGMTTWKGNKMMHEALCLTLSHSFAAAPNLDTVEIVSALKSYYSSANRSLSLLCGMRSIFQAVAFAGKPLKRLAVHSLAREVFQLSDEDIEKFKAGLESIECLTLSFDTKDFFRLTPDNHREMLARGVIRQLLVASQHLRYLRVHVQMDFKSSLLSIEHIFKDHTFSCLRALNLAFLSVAPKMLENVLLAHKDTLRYVQLADFQTTSANDGTWDVFFRAISQQLPHVRTFYLYGRWKTPKTIASITLPVVSHMFGNTLNGRSSLKAHAMSRFLIRGGALPTIDGACHLQIPDHNVVERASSGGKVLREMRRIYLGYADTWYIDTPADVAAPDEDEAEDFKFWRKDRA